MSIYAERSKRIIMDGQINPQNEKLYNQYKRAMTIKGLSPKTIYNYETDLMAWFRFMHSNQYDLLVVDATEDDLEEFFYHCQTLGNNANRIKRRMSSISAFYIFLKKKKVLRDNPIEMLDRPTNVKPVTVQTYLTMEQVDLMKKKLKENDDLLLETYALFSLSTMARVNAISNIKWNQINFDERKVENVMEKGDKAVDLYFSEEVKELLIRLKNQREEQGVDCEYVFAVSYRGNWQGVRASTLHSWCKKVGELINSPLHPHDFRHSGATLLKNMGMALEDVSTLLNHQGTDVTRRFYIKEDKTKLQGIKDTFGI